MLNRTFLDRQKTPAFQYFSGGLIGYTNGSILTNANLHVLTLALIAWLMMAVIAKGGIRVVCKVSYANVVAVIFLLGLLISSGLMETDGVEGFSHFLTFRGDKLLELEGGLITMSSYNDFHENIFWCMLVLLSSMCVCPILVSVCLTPLYSALTVSLSLGQKFANENYREMLYHFIDLDGVVTTASALSMVPKISGGL
uniref:Uncharacterized protein n=1 Tax=Ditylenchus dipsaci TaxID=166011 RepID=A0A915D708_9BILA